MGAAALREGDLLANKYRIDRVIGQGGMGLVLAAFHLELEQPVAVKVLHPELAERGDAAARFRREARAAAKIRSEHVVRVLDVGTLDGGGAYMVMEYLDGNDLAEEMNRRGKLPIAETLDYILQACEAVSEAHIAAIIHRDLKPANLFLALRPDGSRVAKVLDFGISKSVVPGSTSDPSLTGTSTIMGSPLYMSPEQMRSARDVDARTDVWSIGTILYEALAGQPPFVGDSVPQICTSLLNDPPPPMQTFRTDVPPALEQIIFRCLAKNRDDRWGSVGELADALAPFAPQGSRVHAARANRSRTALETSFAGSGERPRTTPDIDTLDPAPPNPSQQAAAPTLVASSPSQPRPVATLDSWGTTGSGKRSPSRVLLFAVGIAMLGLLAVAAVMTLKRPEEPATSPMTVLSAQPAQSALPTSLTAGQAPVAPGETPSAAVETTPPTASAAVKAAPSASVTPVSGRPTPAKMPAAAKHDAANRPPGARVESISDFGGRR